MKAITLHEPFATLIARGFKEVETRGWYTSYRGPLAIHAANRKPDPVEISHVSFALGANGHELPEFTFGAVVCVCQLVACLPATLVLLKTPLLKPPFTPARGWEFEQNFGNYDAGRWAWILRDVREIKRPIACKGNRKLWEWNGTHP